jgi:hypothetical protein
MIEQKSRVNNPAKSLQRLYMLKDLITMGEVPSWGG